MGPRKKSLEQEIELLNESLRVMQLQKEEYDQAIDALRRENATLNVEITNQNRAKSEEQHPSDPRIYGRDVKIQVISTIVKRSVQVK